MDEVVNEKERNEWKDKIFAINNPKLLRYIQELIYARQSAGRADAELDKPKEDKNKSCEPCGPFPHDEPTKYKPMFPTEEDPEKVV